MLIFVKWDRESRQIELPEKSTIEDLLSELSLPPDAFIATKGMVPIPLTEILSEGDSVKLIRVASGG